MLTNPLIIATVAGLLVKASGLTVPQTATTFLSRIWATTRWRWDSSASARASGSMTSGITSRSSTSVVCRLLAVPAIAWGAVTLAGLDPVEAGVAILFAALPTAHRAAT